MYLYLIRIITQIVSKFKLNNALSYKELEFSKELKAVYYVVVLHTALAFNDWANKGYMTVERYS